VPESNERTCGGHCCREFYLNQSFDELTPECRAIFVPFDWKEERGWYRYHCKNFDRIHGVCKDYPNRPQACRDYGVTVPCAHAGCTWAAAKKQEPRPALAPDDKYRYQSSAFQFIGFVEHGDYP